MSKYYAGIGSRQTPRHILDLMTAIAKKLDGQGWVLRSGGAKGADEAFEKGSTAGERTVIYRAHHAHASAIELASKHHPAWDRCNDYTRKLHGRNSMIVLGAGLDQPVEFVVCWTPNAAGGGGTGLGIRLAKAAGIRVFDLADVRYLVRLQKFVAGVE